MPIDSRVRSGRSGFTLIELLVVISIIALLVSILLPALAGARLRAMVVRDSAQMRGVGMAAINYAADNRGQTPTTSGLSNFGTPSVIAAGGSIAGPCLWGLLNTGQNGQLGLGILLQGPGGQASSGAGLVSGIKWGGYIDADAFWGPLDRNAKRNGWDWRNSFFVPATQIPAESMFFLRGFIGQAYDAAWNTTHSPLVGMTNSHGPHLRHIMSTYSWRGADFAYVDSSLGLPTQLVSDMCPSPGYNVPGSITNATVRNALKDARTESSRFSKGFMLKSWNDYQNLQNGTASIQAWRGDGSAIVDYRNPDYYVLVATMKNWWDSSAGGWTVPDSRNFWALDQMHGISDR